MIKNIIFLLLFSVGLNLNAQSEPIDINSVKLKIDKNIENNLDKTWDSLKTTIPQKYSKAVINSKKPRSIFFENNNYYFFVKTGISNNNSVKYNLLKLKTECKNISEENISKLWDAQSRLQFEMMVEKSYKDEMVFEPAKSKDGFKFYSIQNYYFNSIKSLLKYLGK